MSKPPRKRRRTAPSQQAARANTPSPVDQPTWIFPQQGVYDGDNRDLAALLNYGPAQLPYTAGWTDSRIEQVRAFKHWVYIAIDTIAKTIASTIPNVTYVTVNGDDNALSPAKRFDPLRRKALLPLLAHERLDPVSHDHPLLRLLCDPNDPDTAYDLLYETVLYHRLTGSAYWWCPKNEVTGLPDAIWVLPSHWVWPLYGKPGQSHLLGWELRPVEGNYLRRFLPLDEVIAFRSKNPISKIDGYSPLTAGAQWTDTLTMVNTARWHAYRNGTFPTVAVQFDGTYNDPTEQELRRIEAKFIQRYVGENKSNKPLFLPPGVKVTPLNLKVNEMVFGDTAKETRDNLLSLFGVPPVIAGIMEGLTYGSLAAAQAGFYSLTICPLLRFYGQVITEKLARLYDLDLRVWWEDMTPADPQLVEEQIKTDLLAGAITVDEIRLMRGRQPYPEGGWGDNAVVPVNMTVVPIDKPFPVNQANQGAANDKPGMPLGGDSTDLPDSNSLTQPNHSDKE